MATQYVEFIASPGQTLTVTLFPVVGGALDGTSGIAASAVAENATARGNYRATFTDLPAGTYQLHAFNSTPRCVAIAGAGGAKLTTEATAGTYREKADAPEASEATVTEFSADALAQLTSVGVRLFSRQPRPGRIELVQYDEWSAENQLLRFTDAAGTTWPDMAADTPVVLRIEVGSVRKEAAGVLVNGSGVDKEITVAFPRDKTGAFPASQSPGSYQLLREPGTANEWLLDEGSVIVTRKIPAGT